MNIAANIVGVLAVVLYVLCYQMKTRSGIILMNAASRVLFVTQYLMLGAFEGALMDVIALCVAVLYRFRGKGVLKGRDTLVCVLANAAIVLLGLTTYRSPISLLPIFGVLFETLAMWLKKERTIRVVSLLGAPPWLVYNTWSGAYGSSVGNVITLVSIAVAIVRYDVLGKEKDKGIGAG